MARGKKAYKSEYCQQLIQHMKEGKSFESFGAAIGLGRRTIYDWTKTYPEFEEAKEEGHAHALNFYEEMAITKIKGIPTDKIEAPRMMDTALIIFFLKTRFRTVYSEKQEIELSGNVSYKKEELSKLSTESLLQIEKLIKDESKGQ